MGSDRGSGRARSTAAADRSGDADRGDDDSRAPKRIKPGGQQVSTEDPVRAYLSRIGRVPLLDAAQEVDLARRIECGLYASERLRQAGAGGEQEKREIIASADREVAITLATAQQEGETTRGLGDAERTRIFAQAFGKDPNFAAFYRSMQAYEASLGQGDTTMVLSPDSAFFRYFDKGPSGR